MCGIFGVITERDDIFTENSIRLVLSELAHRGPDGEGIFTRGNVTLGHRRLSVIDIDLGTQPMQSPDGLLCVTYNGEIYNYRELYRELAEKGYQFRTNSDTEVLLAAYREWGVSCLDRFRGMFAFALANFEREELFLARDVFGQKPLLYRASPDYFAFASTLPALVNLASPSSLTIDPEAVGLFFSYQYIPQPHTIYREVRKLSPGTALLVGFDGRIKRQWRHAEFSFKPLQGYRLEDALDEADVVLEEAVRLHTRTDVPIGVFLSGGIDSTLIASYCARVLGREIPAFTMAFKEEELSELEYAKVAAERLGLKLHVSMFEENGLERLGDILSHYGEPYGDSSVLPTWHICKAASEQVKVVLSGDGGDELFGGYNTYINWIQHLGPSGLRRLMKNVFELRPGEALISLKKFLQTQSLAFFSYANMAVFRSKGLARLLAKPWRSSIYIPSEPIRQVLRTASGREGLDILQSVDIASYLPGCMLPKIDVTSGSLGLEVRAPLLDNRVSALAALLPASLRTTEQEQGKVLFKHMLLKQGFPESFVNRRKQGFGMPVKHWFLPGGKARLLLETLLIEHGRKISEYLELSAIKALLATHSPKVNKSAQLWLILAFVLWLTRR